MGFQFLADDPEDESKQGDKYTRAYDSSWRQAKAAHGTEADADLFRIDRGCSTLPVVSRRPALWRLFGGRRLWSMYVDRVWRSMSIKLENNRKESIARFSRLAGV